MKKVFIILLFCTTILGQSNYKSTMSLLKMKSSEILTDSEGEFLTPAQYIIQKTTSIIQIDKNSFEVIVNVIQI